MAVKAGDKVQCSAEYDVYGTHLASFVRTNTYDVISVKSNGDVVIGKGSAVTAVVSASSVRSLSENPPTPTPPTPEVPPAPEPDPVQEAKEDALTAEQVENELEALLNNTGSNDILKYNMRLFGIPHQYTQYCDYRAYSMSSDSSHNFAIVGRKFIENIMLEAPVLTVIPGKPMYLPAAKDKKGTSHALISAANGDLSELLTKIKDENLHEALRYYDFKADYFSYIKYVNIMCAVAAAFLDLNNIELDGTPLIRYDWRNYRWNSREYKYAVSNAANSAMDTGNQGFLSAFTGALKELGGTLTSFISGNDSGKGITAFDADTKEDMAATEALEDILTQTNFVQFFIDSAVSTDESSSNQVGDSFIVDKIDAGQQFIKEVAFIANSGGVDINQLTDATGGGIDALNQYILGDTGLSEGTVGGVLNRFLSSMSNVIQGDNMIFPKIYQKSEFTKHYSITVDLRTPQGNKLSYFLNVLVPLFHLMALAIPKQSTANTYSSPFLVRAYVPGILSCNLGIVDSISITRNPNNDAWTVDGYSNEVKVQLSITDLYSDLTMTPAGSIELFLANSSLIEYIATNCGVNLTVPQLKARVLMFSSVVSQSFESVPESVEEGIFNGIESIISSLIGV